MIKEESFDLFIVGLVFNVGRYGVVCGIICKVVEEELNIFVIIGMYKENLGVDMFKLDLYIVFIGNLVVSFRKVVLIMMKLGFKLVRDEEIGFFEEEGYIMRGIRKNFFYEFRGFERVIDMLVKKMKGESFEIEYLMFEFDRVIFMKFVKDLFKIKFVLVIFGGIVLIDNLDKIEFLSVIKYGIYDLIDMDFMLNKEFIIIYGGYDRVYVFENLNLVVLLDVVREFEKEGVIGELVDYFIIIIGIGMSVGNFKRFGEEFFKKLLEDDVDVVILIFI